MIRHCPVGARQTCSEFWKMFKLIDKQTSKQQHSELIVWWMFSFASHYWLDSNINGLKQERRNSIVNHWSYVFFVLSCWYIWALDELSDWPDCHHHMDSLMPGGTCYVDLTGGGGCRPQGSLFEPSFCSQGSIFWLDFHSKGSNFGWGDMTPVF